MVESYLKSVKFRQFLLPIRLVGIFTFLSFIFLTEISFSQEVTCTVTLNSGESISDAMTAAEAGDTICLEAGTYDGGFTIDKDDITLIGIDSAERSVISGGSMGVRISNSLNVRLEWLEIKDFSNSGIYGIGTSSAPTEGVEVHDNIVLGGGNTGVLMSNSTNRWAFTENLIEDNVSAIRLRGADNVVSNNQFVDNVIDIEFTAITNSTVTDNLLSNGIVFSASNFNHTITGNTFPNGDVLYFSTSEDNPTIPTNARQIIVLNATNLVITGFVLSDSVIPIQVSSSAGAHVLNNTIRNLADNTLNTTSSGAIRVGGSPNALVNNNILENNDVRAIHVTSSDGAEIYENQLTANRQGIQVRQSDDVKVYGNTISDTNDTSRNRTGNGINVVSSERIQITDNQISNSNEHGIHDSRLTSSVDAIIQGNTITGSERSGIAWVDSRDAIIDGNTVSLNGTGIEGPFDAIIRNNIVSDNGNGIRARNNSLVEGNEVRDNQFGVNAVFNVQVNDNIVTGNEAIGVNLGQGNGQTISNNQMSGNAVDIRFNSTRDVTVIDNDMETGIVLFSFYGEYNEYDHEISGNTVNGNPLIYIKNEDTPLIPRNSGQVIVLNSTNVTISELSMLNVASGVSVLFSPGTEVSNLTIEGSGQTTAHNSGLIEIVSSENSVVENNQLSNGKRGVEVRFTESVKVHNNEIGHTEGITGFRGIYVQSSSKNEITDNVINTLGGMRGIEIDGSGNSSIISGNEISNTVNDAMVISFSDSVLVDNNIIKDGDARGLYLSRALDATITNNTITGHGSHGIDTNFNQNRSHRPFLEGNTVSGNAGTGIRLDVEELEMQNNIIEDNDIGAELTAPIVAENNVVQNNSSEGFRISGVGDEESIIEQNTISGNGDGLNFIGSGTLPATQNWWGDASGPSGGMVDPETGTTANGSGDPVSSNVNFDPWLTAEPDDSEEPEEPSIEEVDVVFSNLSLSTDTVYTGGAFFASVDVENVDDSGGTFQAELKVDGVVVKTKSGVIQQGDTKIFRVMYQLNDPDDYDITIEDLDSQPLNIKPGWTQRNFSANNNSSTNYLTGPKTDEVVVKWESPVSSTVTGSPTIAEGIIYYGMFDNHLYSSHLETGEIIWEVDLGASIRSSPVIKDDLIVVGIQSGMLFGINRETGGIVWSRQIGEFIFSSPTIAGNVVYVAVPKDENESFQALDITSGNLLWEYDIGDNSNSTPAVDEGVVYVGSNDNFLYAFDTSESISDPTNRLLWSFDSSNSFGISDPVVDGDRIFFRTGERLYAVDKFTGEEVWSNTLPGSSGTNPVISDGVLYIGSQAGIFYAFNADDGSEIWNFEPSISFGTILFSNSDPVVADGIVYAATGGNVSTNRRFIGLETATGNVVFEYEGLQNPNAGPVLFDGIAYIGQTSRGVSAFRSSVPEDYIADPDSSSFTATSPHWADGVDEMRIDILVINEFGNGINNLTQEDFELLGSESISISNFEERFADGSYRIFLTNGSVEEFDLGISVKGVVLSEQHSVEFLSIESNWSAVNIDELRNFIDVNAVHFLDENRGWLLGGFEGDGFGDETQILKTTDGGITWTEQFFTEDYAMLDLYFANEESGWVVGGTNFVLHTDDGGETWTQQIVDESASFLYFQSVFFIDENTGWITGEDYVYKTDNGGESWTIQNLPSFTSARDIYFTDNETGWVGAFNEPGILKTTDGGDTWLASADTSRIHGISFVDDQSGFAVGWNGAFYKTTDGGGNWQTMPTGSTANLYAVTFFDENIGWLVGSWGTIIATSDGGNTLEREYPGTSDNIVMRDVQFINPELGWATGRNGVVLKYEIEDPGPLVSASSSEVAATTPHIADGADSSTVTVTLVDTEGNSLSGISGEDFSVSVTGETTETVISETESSGVYSFNVTSVQADTVSVTIIALGIELEDQPEIIFTEPIVVDADSSVITATSPHIADGEDTSEVTITVITTQGDTLSGLESEDFSRNVTGSTILGSIVESEEPGIYTFTVAATEPQTSTVTMTVLGIELTDQPEIVFEEAEEPSEPVVIVNADSSIVTATSPHIADGLDESEVSVTLKNSNGQLITGFSDDKFSILLSDESEFEGEVNETSSSGTYQFNISSLTKGELSVSVIADGVELSDTPVIVFEQSRAVDPDSSSVIATSPHVASGQDSSSVSVTLKNRFGEEISGFENEDFLITLSAENAGAGHVSETDSSGVYLFSVASTDAENVEVIIEVEGVVITDQPSILFEPVPEPIPEAPELVSITEEESQINLNWNVESEEFIASYKIYRGTTIGQIAEFNVIDAGVQLFTETDLQPGSTYYAVSAVNNDGEEGELSNILSYVNDQVLADTEWQLASIPLGSAVIETDLATIFDFTNSYNETQILEHSKGYWIKSKTFESESIEATGAGLDSTSIVLREGWNLIGSLSDSVSIEAIDDVDGVLTDAPVYLFSDNDYEATEHVIPNSGHWIFASDSGRIDLSIYTVVSEPEQDEERMNSSKSIAESVTAGPKLIFSTEDKSAEIVLSDIYLTETERHQFMMPPLAPEPVLDVRTLEHTRVINNEPTRLELRSIQYPVHVEVEGLEDNFEYAYRLTVENEGTQRAIDLVPGQTNTLTEEYDYMRLEKIHVDELITEHRLMPNYPNPFNPATTIHYQLREQSEVRIEVYDIIGRRVQVLANETQYSGEYRVSFDARSLASGVYIIRFMAGNHMDVRKMTLIK